MASYNDRHAFFWDVCGSRKLKGEEPEINRKLSQFDQAMEDLEAGQVLARSPQARERVKRAAGVFVIPPSDELGNRPPHKQVNGFDRSALVTRPGRDEYDARRERSQWAAGGAFDMPVPRTTPGSEGPAPAISGEQGSRAPRYCSRLSGSNSRTSPASLISIQSVASAEPRTRPGIPPDTLHQVTRG